MKLDNIAPLPEPIASAAERLAESFDGWPTEHAAWHWGFRDGFYDYHLRLVNKFHSAYERGQIAGMAERVRREAAGQSVPQKGLQPPIPCPSNQSE